MKTIISIIALKLTVDINCKAKRNNVQFCAHRPFIFEQFLH